MNIFKQFIKSLYSPKDIATFHSQGIGKTILYVFFLSMIAILPISHFMGTGITNGVSFVQETIRSDIPDFEIKDGTLTADNEEPLAISKDGFMIFVDDSGTWTPEDIGKQTANGIALLKQQLVLVSGGNVQPTSYSTFNMTITNDSVSQYLDSVDKLLVVIISVIILILYLFNAALMFIKVSFISIIGLLFKGTMNKDISYRHIWRLAAYSITLPTVFFTIMNIFQATVNFGSLINWFVSFTMLYLAIKETQKQKEIQ